MWSELAEFTWTLVSREDVRWKEKGTEKGSHDYICVIFFFFFKETWYGSRDLYKLLGKKKFLFFFFFFTVEKRYAKRPPFLAKNEMGERKEKLAETGWHSQNVSQQLALMMIKIHCSPLRLEGKGRWGMLIKETVMQYMQILHWFAYSLPSVSEQLQSS